MEGKKYEILEQKMCKELELLEQKYQNQAGDMAVQDLDKIDKLYHALKSMATYNAMKEAEEYEDSGFSGARGRSPSTGRYVSRNSAYDDGYSQGYSEAMSQMSRDGNMGNSGHYSIGYPPVNYMNRRW